MLTVDNLKLRAPEPEDVDFLFELENDQKLWHLSNTLTPFSRFDLEQFVLQTDKDIFKTKQARFMIVRETKTGLQLIGAIDLFDFDPIHHRAGLGIVITEEERKKGYAGKALDLIIDYSFKVLELHQLYCNIESTNTESISLFKKKGFALTGVKKDWNNRKGKWIDEHLFQLINESYDF